LYDDDVILELELRTGRAQKSASQQLAVPKSGWARPGQIFEYCENEMNDSFPVCRKYKMYSN
jgi:hypothetical protein